VTTIRGLAEVVLWVHDLPASVAFYRDLLGLPVISPPERTNPIFLQAGPGAAGIPAMVVLVQLPPDAPPFSQPRTLHHLALEVAAADFDALNEHLVASGRQPRTGQHPVIPSRTMYIDDPTAKSSSFAEEED
jgi:catechol 2,3-dioxygenase-like lactoylglutathione lyase family enzyme